MSDMTQSVHPIREVLKFSSFEEQETENDRYWSTRTIAEKMEATSDLVKHANSIRILGPANGKPSTALTDVRPVSVGPSREVRKFSSYEEQEEWNDRFARRS